MGRHVIDRPGAPVSRAMRQAFLSIERAGRTHPAVRKAHARATTRDGESRLRHFVRIDRRVEA